MRLLLIGLGLLVAGLLADRWARADEAVPAGPQPACMTQDVVLSAISAPGMHYLPIVPDGGAAERFRDWLGDAMREAGATTPPDLSKADHWLLIWRDGVPKGMAMWFDADDCRVGFVAGPISEMLPAAKGLGA